MSINTCNKWIIISVITLSWLRVHSWPERPYTGKDKIRQNRRLDQTLTECTPSPTSSAKVQVRWVSTQTRKYNYFKWMAQKNWEWKPQNIAFGMHLLLWHIRKIIQQNQSHFFVLKVATNFLTGSTKTW